MHRTVGSGVFGVCLQKLTHCHRSFELFTFPNPTSTSLWMSRLNNKIQESLFGFESALAKAEGFLTSSHFQACFLSEKVSDERRK